MSSSAAWQLAGGMIAILIIFALAFGAKRTVSIGILLILIPFQVIDTRYASSSVLIAYALVAILWMSGGLKVRMLPEMGAVVLAYFASLALADRDLTTEHLIFIFQFSSCFAVLLLAYNFARLVGSERSVVDLLFAINVVTIAYCGLQLIAGPGESFVPFGIETFAFNSNRDPDDPRLVGPFGNPGSTAGYFTLMIFVCAIDLIYAGGRRRLLVLLLTGLNLIGLVATGNRTGFLIMLAMFPIFLFVFRRELGARRVTQYVVGGALVLAIASAVAVMYTDFGRMYQRLSTVTRTEQGVPTTRAETWPIAVEKIKQDPWFGEGPYFLTEQGAEGIGQAHIEWEELGELTTAYDPYPHSLYLYLLRTVGVVGLVAVLWFFLRAGRILYGASQRESMQGYQLAITRLGMLLIPVFLIAQITLEFNRPDTMDYAQFVFALVGMLIGTSDR